MKAEHVNGKVTDAVEIPREELSAASLVDQHLQQRERVISDLQSQHAYFMDEANKIKKALDKLGVHTDAAPKPVASQTATVAAAKTAPVRGKPGRKPGAQKPGAQKPGRKPAAPKASLTEGTVPHRALVAIQEGATTAKAVHAALVGEGVNKSKQTIDLALKQLKDMRLVNVTKQGRENLYAVH